MLSMNCQWGPTCSTNEEEKTGRRRGRGRRSERCQLWWGEYS